MSSHYVTGLDIGTATIKAAVAEIKNGKPALRATFSEPSFGMRKGSIAELGEVSPAIGRVFSEIRKRYKFALKNVYANIGTPQVKIQSSRGIVAVSRADSEIYQDDVDKVMRASQAVNLAPNRLIIHNVTREYIVDGVGDITEPLGLSGNRLEVNCLVIDAFAPHVKSVIKAVEVAGGRVGGLVFGPLAASRAALSKRQKDLGVLLIDIGAGTTGFTAYEENKLVGTGVIPLGAANITNDIAVGLRIPVSAAEHLKLQYGYAVAKEVNPRETVELKKFVPQEKGTTSRRFIAEIIESRLAEILDFVNNELKSMGKAGKLAGGVVLVGAAAKMPGMTELMKHELRLASQVGMTLRDEWSNEGHEFGDVFEDPESVTMLGLVLSASEYGKHQQMAMPSLSFSSIKDIFKNFIP